ncbi:MAG TPA: single-stranded DNA-binding protein [Candidatus Eisenbacteria bacterium]|nr:single-stranded DNA-binding protein [Candidatus Eisenbacteria bacterium]
MSVNKVFLLGRLGRDPEVRYTQSGTTVANLRIATNERRPDGNGGWQDATEWHTVVVFGKQADIAKQYLTKGREVFIEGSLRTRQWQDQQGQKRYTTEIVARDIRFVGGRGNAPAAPGERAGEEMGGATVPPDEVADFGGGPDDDIPF